MPLSPGSPLDLPVRRPRKERLREKRPERFEEILRVATRVFATEGYAATNVNRLAELAGVGVGTLYNYLDDKDDLFLTCVQQAAAADLSVKQSRIDTRAPAMEMLRAILRVDRELMELDPDGQQLLKSVFYGINSHLAVGRTAQELYSGSIDLVQQALQRGQAEGLFDLEGEMRLAAILVNGMMETFHVLRDFLQEEPEPSRPHPADRALDLLCRGILSPRARRRTAGKDRQPRRQQGRS